MTKRKKSGRNPYVGTAGELAVMGELAWRGYNIALPEIDKGDDIFSVNDKTGAMLRIQVKAAKGTPLKRTPRTKYQFHVQRSAIETSQNPERYFVFACRVENGFRYLVMSQSVLRNDLITHNAGSPGEKARDRRRFNIHIHGDGTAKCSDLDWTSRLEDWKAAWPELK